MGIKSSGSIYLHENSAAKEPVLASLSVVSKGVLPAHEARSLGVNYTVVDTRCKVRLADGAGPVLLRHVIQRWVHARQVEHGGTRLAAQQVPESVANTTVVIVMEWTWNQFTTLKTRWR